MLSRKDGQSELIELVCARFRAGEGVDGTFFGRPNSYLFIGDYKYWLMTHRDAVDLDDGQNYVLNRARLYRDWRDFVIQTGDTEALGLTCRAGQVNSLRRLTLIWEVPPPTGDTRTAAVPVRATSHEDAPPGHKDGGASRP